MPPQDYFTAVIRAMKYCGVFKIKKKIKIKRTEEWPQDLASTSRKKKKIILKSIHGSKHHVL